MRRVLVAVLVLGLVAAACGDSGGGERSSAEQALVDAIRDEILDDEDPDSPFGEAEATCVGEGAVGRLGVDGLLELGITVEDADPGNAFEGATDEQIDAVIDVTLDCVDFRQVFVDSITAEADISSESADCLGDALGTKEFLAPIVAAGFRGESTEFGDDPEAAQQVFEAIVDCLSAEELANLGSG